MKPSDFTRDPARVYKGIRQVGSSLIATEPMRIMIPQTWKKQGLAIIEDVVTILGMMAWITEDNRFASANISAMIRTEPDRISITTVDDIPYLTLFYDVGSKMMVSTDIVMVDIMVHPIYTAIPGRGRIPWYYSYEEAMKLFHNTGKYNGTDGDSDPAIWSYLMATTCRDPDDLHKYYRQRKTAKVDQLTHPPVVVPLKNVSFNADSLVAKLSGSYFDPGVTSALAHSAKRADTVENILRYK